MHWVISEWHNLLFAMMDWSDALGAPSDRFEPRQDIRAARQHGTTANDRC